MTLPDDPWTASGARSANGDGIMQRGIQPNTGNHGDRFNQTTTTVKQRVGGIVVVSDNDQLGIWQPPSQLDNHLPCPIRDCFMALVVGLVVSLRGGEQSQNG